jgi:RHS repeat-associated protein
VTLRRDYDPWGRLAAGAATGGWAFTGRENEPETALYYYRARYLSSDLGRFISQDPWKGIDGPNAYRYVRNSPTRHSDPTGRFAWGGGVGLAGAFVVVFGFVGDVNFFMVGDLRGNTGLLMCAGLGLGVGAAEAAGVQFGGLLCPNCKTICDLEGLYGQVVGGAGAGAGVLGTLSVSIGSRSFVIGGMAGPAEEAGGFAGATLGGCGLLWKKPECGC